MFDDEDEFTPVRGDQSEMNRMATGEEGMDPNDPGSNAGCGAALGRVIFICVAVYLILWIITAIFQ